MSAGPAGSLRPRTSGPAPARPGAGAPRPGDGQGEGRPAALTLPTPAGRPPEGAPAGPGPGPGPPGRDSGPRRHPRAPRRPRSRRARPAGPRLGTPLFVSVTSGTSGRPSAPGGSGSGSGGAAGSRHDLASPRVQPGHLSFNDSARPRQHPQNRTASPATATRDPGRLATLPPPELDGVPSGAPPRSRPAPPGRFSGYFPHTAPRLPHPAGVREGAVCSMCVAVVGPWREPHCRSMLPWGVRSDSYTPATAVW